MTVAIAHTDDKTVADNNTVVVVQTASPQAEVRPRSRKCKYIIIGVTCSVIAALLTVTVLVAIKLVSDANLQKLRLERSFAADHASVTESCYQDDSQSWVHEYHLTDGAIDTYVIDDITKGVRVFKLSLGDGSWRCFVLQYQPTINATSYVPQLDTEAQSLSGVNKTGAWFKVSEQPINGVLSLVSPTAAAFCDSLPIYLVYPKYTSQPLDDSTGDMQSERVKRATYRYCYIDWMNCNYFSYSGHPEFRYYGCALSCVDYQWP